MTEEEARGILRDPHTPCLPPAGILGDARDWIAEQPWHRTPRGWLVLGIMADGRGFHIDIEPGAVGSLYVTPRLGNEKLPGIFIGR